VLKIGRSTLIPRLVNIDWREAFGNRLAFWALFGWRNGEGFRLEVEKDREVG
jgi:hypothetical protein